MQGERNLPLSSLTPPKCFKFLLIVSPAPTGDILELSGLLLKRNSPAS